MKKHTLRLLVQGNEVLRLDIVSKRSVNVIHKRTSKILDIVLVALNHIDSIIYDIERRLGDQLRFFG
jgi:hypothetical protein